jgi:hypothetical protein
MPPSACGTPSIKAVGKRIGIEEDVIIAGIS